MVSRLFAHSWGSRKSHALVKVQAKLTVTRTLKYSASDEIVSLAENSHYRAGRWRCSIKSSSFPLFCCPPLHPRIRISTHGKGKQLFFKVMTQNLHAELPLMSLSLELRHTATLSCVGGRDYCLQLGSHLPCSSVWVCVSCGVILLLQGRRLLDNRRKWAVFVTAQNLTSSQSPCRYMWGTLEPLRTLVLPSRKLYQEEDSKREGWEAPCKPLALQSPLCTEQRPQQGTQCPAGPWAVLGGWANSWTAPACGCHSWNPSLLFLISPSPTPTSPMKVFCRLMNLEGGGRPQVSVFMQERINEPLGVVYGLELFSVSAQAGDGLPPGGRRAATKLWSCCPVCDLSGFVCDPFVPSGAGHTLRSSQESDCLQLGSSGAWICPSRGLNHGVFYKSSYRECLVFSLYGYFSQSRIPGCILRGWNTQIES